MVTKWKKISKKICQSKKGYVCIWIVMLFAMVFFFAGLGIGFSDVTDLGEAVEDVSESDYGMSRLHREHVRNAFEEVSQKAMKANADDSEWDFQGIYDMIVQHSDYFFAHVTNIPDEAYHEYMQESTSGNDEEGGVRELQKDSKVEKTEDSESCIEDERELSVWFFQNSTNYYYIWNGDKFIVGDKGSCVVQDEIRPLDRDTRIAIGFTFEQMNSGQEKLDVIRGHITFGGVALILSLLVFLFCLFTFILGSPVTPKVRIYTDILGIAFASAGVLIWHLTGEMLGEFFREQSSEQMIKCIVPEAVTLGVISTVAIFFLYTIVCDIRKRQGREQFVCYMLWNRMKRKITGEAFYGQGICECEKRRRTYTFRLLLFVFCALVLLIGSYMLIRIHLFWSMEVAEAYAIPAAGVLLYVVHLLVTFALYRKGSEKLEGEYHRLSLQMDELFAGNYQNDRILDESSVFAVESQKMSMLGCQMQENVEKQIRAEKMKIDLITNVSHDLKTPLTSIISYIDLLSKEELSPVSRDYVKVLENKSERLRKMIADVFDLAKASSGNMKINKEKLDLNKLLVQILADMEQQFECAPAKLVQEISETTGMIKSDGEKLYRVLQNILDNALNYSMADTRIYVTLKVENRKVFIRVKNVSAYEMNFTKEEVLGRFFRGDKSRSTEGSGLGLAIAKEFTELCGGGLDLGIEGDVFWVEIVFPCCDVIAK